MKEDGASDKIVEEARGNEDENDEDGYFYSGMVGNLPISRNSI